MNCQTCREWLTANNDLGSQQRPAELDEHLAECDACRGYGVETANVLRLLDVLPDPMVRVDARSLLAVCAARADRSRRRWRNVALLATAAGLLLAAWVTSGMEVELGPGALRFAWGREGARPTPALASEPPSGGELARLNEIAGLLAAELDDQDYRHRRDVALLLGQIRQLQSAQRADIAVLERDFRALYAATQTSYTSETEIPRDR